MSGSNQTQTTEEAVARLMSATAANDAEAGPARHSEQTDQCPNIARFGTVLKFGGTWTAEEAKHLRTCPFCQKTFAMFAAAASAANAETDASQANQETKNEKTGAKQVEQPKPGEETKRD